VSGSLRDRVGVFIAGVQKAGTTSLYAHFCEHPQLAAGNTKELHYFDDEGLDWMQPDYERFHACFDRASEGRIRFDATPIYMFWPRALERMRRYNPQARLIVLFREPIDRAYSSWSMEQRRGVDPLPFGEAIRVGRARLPLDDPTAPVWRIHSYVERGFYGRQVATALSLFPREQLLFLRSSALAQDCRATLRAVSDFLDVQPFPDTGPKFLHQRPSSSTTAPMRPEDRRHLQCLYHADTVRFAALSGVRVDDWPSMHPTGAAPNTADDPGEPTRQCRTL
jgi:hypothetical protein